MGLKKESPDGLFLGALKELATKGAGGRPHARQLALNYARDMLGEINGFETALIFSPLFDSANLFVSTPWETPARLKPHLVRGTLLAGGLTAVSEMLSDIRILAIALGIYETPSFSREEAARFIDEVLVLNLDLAFPKLNKTVSPESIKIETLHPFFAFIAKNHNSAEIFDKYTAEIEELSAQRPIVNEKIITMIEAGESLSKVNRPLPDRFLVYKNALHAPTALTQLYGKGYPLHLGECNEEQLSAESEQFVKSMDSTGIVSKHHVTIIKYISEKYPGLLCSVLGLSQTGKNNIARCLEKICALIGCFLTDETRQSVYGLANLLNSERFSEKVLDALCSLPSVSMHRRIAERIEKCFGIKPDQAMGLIIGSAVSLLGSPLGIAQGNNPTCQSTRALCYWAQTKPEYLMGILLQVMASDELELEFEGQRISSSCLNKIDLDLSIPMDPVSVILLPHLDCLYNEMLKRAGGRIDDPHKWVNPAFYGSQVLSGFSSKYHDPGFFLHFKKFYDPKSPFVLRQNLPQPAGIFIFDDKGNNLGAHAILIQRAGFGPNGIPRIYFYNPHNDSRQRWTGSIITSIGGNGEKEGEASLPLEDFIKCLYAFHYPEVK